MDSDLILPATPPTRYGYTFTGWKVANYIPIEYLESTGTQWIDTGVRPNNNTRVLLSYVIPENNIDSNLFGARNGYLNKAFAVIYNTGNLSIQYGNYLYDNISLNSGFYNTHLFFDANKNEITLKNDKYEYIATNTASNSVFQTDYNMYIFNINSGGSVGRNPGIMYLYYMQIYYNNSLVRDFIPVLDYIGTPCLYDKVSKTFFYNQGTGDFVAGPVVSE